VPGRAAAGFVATRRRQSGAALLLLLTFVVLAVAAGLVQHLNGQTATVQVVRDQETATALAEAKAALIGYAASYADAVDPGAGPGFLPCPDTDPPDPASPGYGSSDACEPDPVMRLPWRTLGTGELRDASGELLWYAVSGNYQAPPTGIVNSETPGQLSVDGANDVVAIVFAPGEPVGGQVRETDPERTDIANYLEDDNASPGDQSFVTQAAGDFNDRLARITRGELMAVVERRVLAEASDTLSAYFTEHGAYPWLATFGNPEAVTTLFNGNVSTREGFLPALLQDEEFPTALEVSWQFGGYAHDTGPTTITEADLAGPATLDGGDISAASCRWTTLERVACAAVVPKGSGIIWTYIFTYTGGFDPPGQPPDDPTATTPRRREPVILEAPFASAVDPILRIQERDTSGTLIGTGWLSIDTGSTGSIQTSLIKHDLAVPDELPAWFTDNEWHHLVYAAVSEGFEPGGGNACGGVAPSCLTVTNGVPPIDDNHALVVAAGGELAAQSRPSDQEAEYYEGENDQSAFPEDDVFERRERAADFNDQVRVVAP